jgi:hypothetical protein
MYSVRVQGLPISRRLRRLALASFLVAAAGGCEFEWGGASFHLEDPSPPPVEADVEELAAEEVELPLPAGPLLWAVRSTGAGGEAVAMPVARLENGVPRSLDFPEPPPEGYRARFDSAFAVRGTEMALGAAGSRIGSLVFSGPPRTVDAGCPSVVPARALLPPGVALPVISFGLGAGTSAGDVLAPRTPVVDDRIRTFGPILTEQLLRQGGESRPFLAQRADLVAVPWPGDNRPAMAATDLINDSVGADAHTGAATSLFFLARFGATGYVAEWSEMRTYSGSESREIFTWFAAVPGPNGRIDFAVRRDGPARLLVASTESDEGERGIDWTEGARCPALELLEIPAI